MARLSRFVPICGYHHILMTLLVIAIILLSLLLSGCTSSSSTIPSIYLISLSYQNTTNTPAPAQVNAAILQTFANLTNGTAMEVRTGYFGICVSYEGGIWLCNNNAAGLAKQFSPNQDPLNLIWASAQFKDGVVFPGLLIAAIFLACLTAILLSTFPSWHEEFDDGDSEREVKPFPSRPVSQVALAMSALASLITLISVLWQHTASVASATTVQDMAYETVKGEVGTTTMALGWAGLVFLVIPSVGLLIMILSIQVIEELIDDS